VGRNGIYIDNKGQDWNATVTKVVAQPISIREAFFNPYRWLSRTIEGLAIRRASTAEANRQNQLKNLAEKSIEPSQARKRLVWSFLKIDVGTVAAIGVALGSYWSNDHEYCEPIYRIRSMDSYRSPRGAPSYFWAIDDSRSNQATQARFGSSSQCGRVGYQWTFTLDHLICNFFEPSRSTSAQFYQNTQ